MGDIRATPLDPRTVQPLIRPDATAALRPADPSKERFQVGDGAVDKRGAAALDERAAQFSVDPDDVGGGALPAPAGRSRGGGRGLLGAFSNFLAKFITQSDSGADSAAGTRLVGISAYQGAAQRNAASFADGGLNDVQAAGLPRLSSGRVLDLTA